MTFGDLTLGADSEPADTTHYCERLIMDVHSREPGRCSLRGDEVRRPLGHWSELTLDQWLGRLAGNLSDCVLEMIVRPQVSVRGPEDAMMSDSVHPQNGRQLARHQRISMEFIEYTPRRKALM